MSSHVRPRSRLIWAVPLAIAMFGCARGPREPQGYPAAESSSAPTAKGGGPRAVEGGGLGESDVTRPDRMVEAQRDQLRSQCYSTEHGMVSFVIDVMITPDGRVQRADTVSVDGDRGVAECVRARLAQMTFPNSIEGGVHTFTFLFAD
jgi:hypothetical protein